MKITIPWKSMLAVVVLSMILAVALTIVGQYLPRQSAGIAEPTIDPQLYDGDIRQATPEMDSEPKAQLGTGNPDAFGQWIEDEANRADQEGY